MPRANCYCSRCRRPFAGGEGWEISCPHSRSVGISAKRGVVARKANAPKAVVVARKPNRAQSVEANAQSTSNGKKYGAYGVVVKKERTKPPSTAARALVADERRWLGNVQTANYRSWRNLQKGAGPGGRKNASHLTGRDVLFPAICESSQRIPNEWGRPPELPSRRYPLVSPSRERATCDNRSRPSLKEEAQPRLVVAGASVTRKRRRAWNRK